MEEIFTHAPLECPWQIRLLELQPQNPDDEHVYCRIWVVPGGDAKDLDPQYDAKEDRKRIAYRALSYTWGDRTNTMPIMIDNKLHYVTANLFAFLNQMTPKDASQSEFFWIDAVCINQDDVSERSEQVYRMTSIYKNAKRVDIWLGPTADDSDIAISQMKSLANVVLTTNGSLQYLVSKWSKDETWTPFGPDKDFESRTLTAIMNLMRRSWWKRVWVVQEATVPDQENWLICGDCYVLLYHFYLALSTLLNLATSRTEYGMLKYAASNASILHGFQYRRKSKIGYLNLVDLLHDFRNFMATDDRDRIYALLGMVAIDRNNFPSPDYGKGVKQVYRDVVQHLTITSPYGQKLDILGYADDFDAPRMNQFIDWFDGVLQDVHQIIGSDRSTIDDWINRKIPRQLPTRHIAELKQEIVNVFVPLEVSHPGFQELIMGCLERIGHLEAVDLDALRCEVSDFIQDNSVWLTKFAEACDTFFRTQRFGPVLELLEEMLEPYMGVRDTWNEAPKWPNRVSGLQTALTINLSQANGTSSGATLSPATNLADVEEWPSWLPDWRHEQLALSPLRKTLDPRPTWFGISGEPQAAYAASGRDFEIFQIHDRTHMVEFDDDKLMLRGFRFDRIWDLRRLNLNTEIPSETPQTPEERLEPATPYDIGQTYTKGEPISEAFWRTVTADLEFDRASSTFSRQKPPDREKPTSSYLSILRNITSSITSTISKIFRTEPWIKDKTFDPCNGRQLAITEEKLMALVPRSAQLGDEIWVLGGGQVFYVLREHGKFFKLVGECYLHGFMDGEALERLKDGSAMVQNVTII